MTAAYEIIRDNRKYIHDRIESGKLAENMVRVSELKTFIIKVVDSLSAKFYESSISSELFSLQFKLKWT